MFNNNSISTLPRTCASIDSKERMIIFTDINLYLSKISKKRKNQGDTNDNIFKWPVTHYNHKENKQIFVPVSQVLNDINEKILLKIERTERLKDFSMHK